MTTKTWAVLFALLLASVPVSAKGRTMKITLEGPALAEPVVLTGRAAEQFSIWEGPGTTINGVEQTEGFIGDWQRGKVAAPEGLPRLKVSFYTGCVPAEDAYCTSPELELAYVITYAWKPGSTEAGYIYLPSLDDPHGRTNRMSRRRYDGSWVRTLAKWDDVVRPLLPRR